MMPDSAWRRRLRDRFDAASRQHFSLFLRRVIATTAPGVNYQHNWHHDAIGDYLAACQRGQIRRLIINLPPRMLKSTLVSVTWPAWVLGHDPTQRIMAASYAQSLSITHSTDCRTVMEAEWYRRVFPATRLRRGQNEKERFVTTRRGYRLATSVGGATIGEGGNILLVDDPLSPAQALQRRPREAVNQWFDHTFVTRLDDKQRGCIVVVMQRLHKEDLSGYLLGKGGWEHLCLPAIAPARTIIRLDNFHYERAEGEALHAGRENVSLLENTKRELGSMNFNAQYQQAPMAQAGSLIRPEWCMRFDSQSVNEQVAYVQSWDTGVKAGDQHDASACATFALKDGVHQLVDMLVVRLEYPMLKRLIMRHAQRFKPDAVLIEDKGSGQSLLQDLKRETPLPLIAIIPSADKITRAMRITPVIEAGKLALPKFASWLAAFEAEFFSFPDSAHDDQVDAVSQYLNWVRERAGRTEPGMRRL